MTINNRKLAGASAGRRLRALAAVIYATSYFSSGLLLSFATAFSESTFAYGLLINVLLTVWRFCLPLSISSQLSSELPRSARMCFIVYLYPLYLVKIVMGYKDFIESGASTPEMKSYLTDSELVMVTVQLPRTMRDSAKEYATLNGMNFTTLVKQCLIERLTKKD